MKKVTFLVLIVLVILGLTSCSDKVINSFSPPAWIQGTWDADYISYTFTSKNITTYSFGIPLDLSKAYLNNPACKVYENKNNSEYSIKIDMGKEGKIELHFKKLNDKSIAHTAIEKGVKKGPITLIKH